MCALKPRNYIRQFIFTRAEISSSTADRHFFTSLISIALQAVRSSSKRILVRVFAVHRFGLLPTHSGHLLSFSTCCSSLGSLVKTSKLRVSTFLLDF